MEIKVFNNVEEMQPYFDKEINTYDFSDIDCIVFSCDLNIEANIIAKEIKADNIKVLDITALEIHAKDITASNIYLKENIYSRNIRTNKLYGGNTITACEIYANYIEGEVRIFANYIKARTIDVISVVVNGDIIANKVNVNIDIKASKIICQRINASYIDVKSIEGHYIIAFNIKAVDYINYKWVCYAYDSIQCKKLHGMHSYSKYATSIGNVTAEIIENEYDKKN